MALDTTKIGAVYDALFTKIVTQLDTLWTSKKIDAETYATLLGQATSNLIIQVTELMQKQEQVDADVGMKTAQIAKLTSETALINTQKTELIDNGVKDRNVKDKQASLYARQTSGFDENKIQKLYESSMNAWGLAYSSGSLTELVSTVQETKMASLYSNLVSGSTILESLAAPTVTLSASDVSMGSPISLTITNYDATYTYTLNGSVGIISITNTGAGTYSVDLTGDPTTSPQEETVTVTAEKTGFFSSSKTVAVTLHVAA